MPQARDSAAGNSAASGNAATTSIASDAALRAALAELAAIGTDKDRERLAAITERLDAARLRVLVAGEAKRGKSSLVNALLGRSVLPTGVTPLTAVATAVRQGDDPHVNVRYADGREDRCGLDALADLVTERGNPRNRRQVAEVTVYLDSPLLAGGVELVDTPGTGSVFDWDTEAAHAALETMDAAVFVLSADSPASAAERALYEKVTVLSVTTFIVLNKTDHLDADGLAEATEFTQQVLDTVSGHTASGHLVPGQRTKPARSPVYPVSARAALDGGDPGFDAFADAFTAYLSAGRADDLRASAAGQARRIAAVLLDEAALTCRAAELRAGDAAQKVAEFGDRLAEVAVRGRDAVTVVNGESARLLFDLNDAAADDERRLGREVTARLDAYLDGDLGGASAGDIERLGRQQLSRLAIAAADDWREQWRQRVEDGLAAADARLAADLAAALSTLRESAAELLGLELIVPMPGGHLAEDRRFFYVVAEDVGQTELLAGAIRRSLPGELGRRRAREHLRREAPGLVAAQVGRARGDLQYRLAETTRALAQTVEWRYTDAADRMRAALRAAEDLGAASSARGAEINEHFAERSDAARHALALLGPEPG